jgi:glycerol-3-phosphate dehydrogenase (NAD(P)+)
MPAAKVAVLGPGAWGTALAHALATKGDYVVVWGRNEEVAKQINEQHENVRYLPGARLPAHLRATVDPVEALDGASMVVFVVPSHSTREVARLVARHIPKGVPIVSATKGIENESLEFMDEVLAHELADHAAQLAFLSGPSFARELVQQFPTAVVIAAKNAEVREAVVKRFHTPYLRTYPSDDVAGVECGGALKNVVALAAGCVDGMGLKHNTRAMLITRGLAEIGRMALARGGSPLTVAGLSGMGDLVLTCTGELSRNRTVGVELGKGRKLQEILEGLGHVAEGVKTARSAYDLARKLGVAMPITTEVYRVLYEDKPVAAAMAELMAHEIVHEWDPRTVWSVTRREG